MYHFHLRSLVSWKYASGCLGRARDVRLLMVALVAIPLAGVASPTHASGHVGHAARVSYYVDCGRGNDANSGVQPARAWRSLAQASAAALQPGDRVLLRRGCAWTGPLVAAWVGTASAPIAIGAYGRGNPPLIENVHDDVLVTGSYLIIDGLATSAAAPRYDRACANNPMGWRVGFHFAPGAHDNILRNSAASHQLYGIEIDGGATRTQILYNRLIDNNMKSADGTSDSGGVGVVLSGDANLVFHNYIAGSDMCSPLFGRDGAAIDVYGGRDNMIAYNTAVQNNNFTEVGDRRSFGNTFVYNVVRANEDIANFLVLHGLGDVYGPVYGTRAYNNTVYLTGRRSYAVQCGRGCGPAVLSLHNNIIWAGRSIGFADTRFDEGDNIYWRADGRPMIWFPRSPSSRVANPQFVDAAGGQLQLRPTSPAIAAGGWAGVTAGFRHDFVGTAVPQRGVIDAGAYQYRR